MIFFGHKTCYHQNIISHFSTKCHLTPLNFFFYSTFSIFNTKHQLFLIPYSQKEFELFIKYVREQNIDELTTTVK